MADFDQAERIEISATTIMKIVKHCRAKPHTETMGVVMGTCLDNTCYIGNSFPSYKPQAASKKGKSKAKKTIVSKAANYFTKINYDNILCGVYVNVPDGKLFSTQFFNDLLDKNLSLADDAKICIVYENSAANLGLNPFMAYKINSKFVRAVKNKKLKEVVQSREIFDELPLRLFRSSPDQAFLAEYVCPGLPDYTGIADEEVSIASLCNSYLKTLEDDLVSYAETAKTHEYSLRKISKGSKSGKLRDKTDNEKLVFVKTVEDLNKKIEDVIGTNLAILNDQ